MANNSNVEIPRDQVVILSKDQKALGMTNWIDGHRPNNAILKTGKVPNVLTIKTINQSCHPERVVV
jgi:hypothetical protein